MIGAPDGLVAVFVRAGEEVELAVVGFEATVPFVLTTGGDVARLKDARRWMSAAGYQFVKTERRPSAGGR